MRAKGLGAKVIVTEVDPVRALEAVMDGYEVMPMREAAKIGDIFCSVTGCRDIITMEHLLLMKEGAIVSNAGHFNVEIDMAALEEECVDKWESRANIMAYRLDNGVVVHVIAEGRLVNIAAADGHPAEIMDLSFAVQALSAKYIRDHHEELDDRVIDVSDEIDDVIARRKLAAWGIEIDVLTPEQEKYLHSWDL
jgi:adenosylhomocysteinase